MLPLELNLLSAAADKRLGAIVAVVTEARFENERSN